MKASSIHVDGKRKICVVLDVEEAKLLHASLRAVRKLGSTAATLEELVATEIGKADRANSHRPPPKGHR